MKDLKALLIELTERGINLSLEGERLRIRARKGALTADLRTLLVSRKAEIVAWLKSQEASQESLPPVLSAPEDRYQPFPLTDIQQAYWIGRSGALEMSGGYHYYLEFDCPALDLRRLNQTFNQLIRRHDMLRAIVLPEGQQQILALTPAYQISVIDLRGEKEAQRGCPLGKELAAIRHEMSHQTLPLDQWPLFDLRVTRLSKERLRLHVSLELIVLDAGSMMTLFREWEALYQNPIALLPPLSLSFRDYVLAEQQLEATLLYQQAQSYWVDRLDALPPAPELPIIQSKVNAASESSPSAQGQAKFLRKSHILPPADWQTLKQRATKAGITPSTLLLAAFCEVLATWSREPQFTINVTLFNRLPLHPEINQIIGDFTSVNLLQVDHSSPQSFLEQAQQVGKQLRQDLEHRYFPGVRVIREWARRQKSIGRPLAPVVFTSALVLDSKDDSKDDFNFHNLFGGNLSVAISQTPQVYLDHQVQEDDGRLIFHWDAVPSLYPDGLLDEMFAAYCGLLEQLVSHEAAWTEIRACLVPPAQLAQQAQINATAAPIPEETLVTLFLKQVAARAEAPAVICSTRRLSYRELYQRANQVAHWLRAQGAKPDTLVAVVMQKGWEQIVAVLGTLLAGAAYLPIDPSLPTKRQHYLLAQGEVKQALTQSICEQTLHWPAAIKRLAVDTQTSFDRLPPLQTACQPQDLAYVLYTSGSTGLPKGVMIEHRNVVNRMMDVAQRFAVKPQDRAIALTALHHDLSVFDIFCMLCIVGGSIVLPEADLIREPAHWAEIMVQEGVTLWNSVPAFMQMMVEHLETAPPSSIALPEQLRWVILSGDFIPVPLPDRLRALLPEVELISAGGPTETTVWDICYPIGEVKPTWPSIPYGKPMSNAQYYILKENLAPCPTWTAGELYIAGVGLARGYWRDEERTQARFITHPQTGQRLYRSGDLGRYIQTADAELGNACASASSIEILGRVDFQVKIQGQRIELGEIEAILRQHPGVKQAVVNALGQARGDSRRQLVAYVVLDEALDKALDKAPQGEPLPKASPQVPDAYDEAANEVNELLSDPIERMEFKLRRPSIRQSKGRNDLAVQLPKPDFDEPLAATYFTRQSHRHYLQTPIPLAEFSAFLSALLAMPAPNSPLPKYRYPSAGSLNPVQTYLYLKPERIMGLAGGFYYYHPTDHQLIPVGTRVAKGSQSDVMAHLSAPNQAIVEQAAFALFLVAELAAIEPIYGEVARDFSLLEAGYMSQLLMSEAPEHHLGLCPIGKVETSILQAGLQLSESQLLLHALVGGRIEPQWRTRWMQNPPETKGLHKPSTWEETLRGYLSEHLPSYMVPQAYVALQALPLTPNGKVDRKALPAPEQESAKESYLPPQNEVEERVIEVVQEILDIAPLGIHHNFFELGATSVNLVQIRNRLQNQFNRTIPMTALFKHSTVNLLAAYLSQEAQEPQSTLQGERQQQLSQRATKQKAALARQKQRRRRAGGGLSYE